MSHDQKPGKMRVVGDAHAARRRGDPSIAAAPAALANDVLPVAAVAPAGRSSMMIAVLFLLGSALGGAALALMIRS